MAAVAGLVGRFLGNVVSESAAFAAGVALGPVLGPPIQALRNEVNAQYPFVPPDSGTLAEGVAQGQVDEAKARGWAKEHGIGDAAFSALIDIANVGPGVAQGYTLWRRGEISEAQFRTVLKRTGLEAEWVDPMVSVRDILLSPAEVASAIQQGHLPNPDILPDVSAAVSPAQGAVTPEAPDQQPPSVVPLTQIDLDPVTEAAGSGVDVERLKVIANLSGLPPGAAELLTMWNRGLIDELSVDAGLREGHLKTKWSAAFKRMRWNVLGASEYANAHLRNWITQEEMYAGGALTGHTKDQMELMFLNRGRPMAPVQAFTAWARDAPHPQGEGVPDRPGTFDKQDFANIIARSDVRPEYLEPLWAIRYAYPPLFQLRQLAQAGALSEERVRTILKYERYEQQDIDALVTYWYRGPSTSTAATPTTKAHTQLWSATHRSYVGEMIGAAEARARFTELGLDAAEQTGVLAAWDSERALIRKQLTPAQIKKAVGENVTNPATGVAWSQADALTALQDRGYTREDALTFLAE